MSSLTLGRALRPALMLLTAALILTDLRLMPAATAAVTTPPLSVKVVDVGTPRYGDDLTFTVSSTGEDVSATVLFGGIELQTLALPRGGAGFSIPTVNRFGPGRSYRLDVVAGNESSSGSTSFSFTTAKIPASVTLAGRSQEYSAPFFGVVAAQAPTSVLPDGRIELVLGGEVKASYAVRTDGTFALPTRSLVPGPYPGAEVRLTGSTYYADTGPGTGSWLGDLGVTPLRTEVAITGPSQITQGDTLIVGAQPKDLHADATYVPDGYLVLSAAKVGSDDFAEISRVYTSNGAQKTFDLTGWTTWPDAEGRWRLRVAFEAGAHGLSSAQEQRLDVRRRGLQSSWTSVDLDTPDRVVGGEPITGTMSLETLFDDPVDGDMEIVVDGQVAMRKPASRGTVAFELPVPTVGTHHAFARYLGSEVLAGSASESVTFTIAKAATTVAVSGPASDGSLTVRVGAVGSRTTPTGPVRILEGGRTLRTVALADGVGRFTLPDVAAGQHRLEIRYEGDERTEPSGTTTTVAVTSSAAGPNGSDQSGDQHHPVATTVKVVKVRALPHRRARLRIAVAAPGGQGPATGTVVVKRGKKTVATGTVTNGKLTLTTKRLPRGRARLAVAFTGHSGFLSSSAKPVKVRVR